MNAKSHSQAAIALALGEGVYGLMTREQVILDLHERFGQPAELL